MIREAILKALKEKKISQRKCAIDLGLDRANLNNYLKNRRSIPVDDIEKILMYLNLKIKD